MRIITNIREIRDLLEEEAKRGADVIDKVFSQGLGRNRIHVKSVFISPDRIFFELRISFKKKEVIEKCKEIYFGNPEYIEQIKTGLDADVKLLEKENNTFWYEVSRK